MAIKHKLTDKAVNAEKRVRLRGDGGNLYLKVSPSGGKSWVFRYRNRATGKPLIMGLGPYGKNEVTLADARDIAATYRQQLRENLDPITERDRVRVELAASQGKILTFKECCDQYIKTHSAGWKNAKHRKQWASTLKTYAEPIMGDLAVNEINDDHVFNALDAIWLVKNETAVRLRGRIEKVLQWAEAKGYREGLLNPARKDGPLAVKLVKPSSIKKVKHHPSLPYPQLYKFMSELNGQEGTAARALSFKILTVARTNEVLGAKWPEIDFDASVWTIPATRMKKGVKHRVPISDDAVAILKAQQGYDQTYVFPGAREAKCLSDMSMLMLVRRMGDYRDDEGRKIVPHGFRSTFKNWAAETTTYPRQLVEFAMAHVNKDTTESAYLHSDLLEKRVPLMSEWATYCTTKPGKKGTVTHLKMA